MMLNAFSRPGRVALLMIVALSGAAAVRAQSPAQTPPPSAAAPAAPAPAAAAKPAPQPEAPPRILSPESRALRASLDASRAEIEQAEASLRRQGLSNEDLQDLRGRLDPVTERLRDQIAEIGPKLDAAKARLDQLGPKPKEGQPAEGAEVARDRVERDAGVADLDEINRLAKALLLQAEQLTSTISDRRRTAFTTALFQRSYSVISPDLWLDVVRSFPRDLRALRLLGEDAWSRFGDRASPFALIMLGLAVGIGAALHIVRRQLAPRLVHREPSASGLSPTRKLVTAAALLLVETLPAAVGSLMIYGALLVLDVLPARLMPVAGALLMGLAFLAFLQGLIEALFAPELPAWRLIEIPDRVVGAISSLGATFGIVVVLGYVLDSVNQAIAAGLPLTVATKGVTAAAAAAVLAVLLRQLAEEPQVEDACLGPYIPTGPAIAGPIRLAGWLLAAAIVLSEAAGYIAFASFLTGQVVWVASLIGLLYLGLFASDCLLGAPLETNSRLSTTLQVNLGLRRTSLRQLGVLASGIAKVVLVIVAIMLALAPWGLESGDIFSNVRSAFFGFKVGDVTVSLSTTIAAIALFLGVLAVTRLVQGWLSQTFLPTTELDSGLRNSIATAAGYLGFFAAGAAAFAYFGLSLEKIAIVAGALSVGIGFGLQSIVNNFVSGLILLWERPIRVGDLVVVGDGEGFVRKISVRATEIETFDRSTVIVPNSSLISGTVKNRMRNDITGRIVMPVNVLRNQDPARAAELLIATASAHPDVLREPVPRVNFRKIGDTWLEFDLVCYVEEVTKLVRVQSDLNFTIFKMLVDEGILPPMGPGAMNVGGLEPVQSALEQIASAIAAGESRPVASAGSTSTSEPPSDETPARLARRQTGTR